MSEKTPKCIDCGSSPDFVVRLASGRWKCVDCRTEWGENWDWNDDPRTKGLQTNLVRLTSERDEAVRVAGELRAKAALLDDVIGHFKPYRVIPEYLHEKTYWQCGDCPCSAPTEAEIQHQANCCWARFDSLTTTGGSEPQKGITE